MSALTPVFLNAEFVLLWSVRQLLRGLALGIGFTSALLTLTLLLIASGLGGVLDAIEERTRITRPSASRVTHQPATSTRGY